MSLHKESVPELALTADCIELTENVGNFRALFSIYSHSLAKIQERNEL
jgi:hypothetical protein